MYLQFLSAFKEDLNAIYQVDPWAAATIMKLLPPLSKQIIFRLVAMSSEVVPFDLFEHWVEQDAESKQMLQQQLYLLIHLRILSFAQTQETAGNPCYVFNVFFKQALLILMKGFSFLFLCANSTLSSFLFVFQASINIPGSAPRSYFSTHAANASRICN